MRQTPGRHPRLSHYCFTGTDTCADTPSDTTPASRALCPSLPPLQPPRHSALLDGLLSQVSMRLPYSKLYSYRGSFGGHEGGFDVLEANMDRLSTEQATSGTTVNCSVESQQAVISTHYIIHRTTSLLAHTHRTTLLAHTHTQGRHCSITLTHRHTTARPHSNRRTLLAHTRTQARHCSITLTQAHHYSLTFKQHIVARLESHGTCSCVWMRSDVPPTTSS